MKLSPTKLPLAENAYVSQEKVVDYLLSSSHPAGRTKARFFRGFGFSTDAWNVLADAIRDHAMTHDVKESEESEFGTKYVVDGVLNTPDGRNPKIRAIWFVERGEDRPRFVTAYPC